MARRLLVVSARVDGGDGLEYGDGVLTRRGTFQRRYTQAELRAYLQDVLSVDALPAAPGVFYLFRDDGLRERYLAGRYRRREVAPRKRISQRRFENHRLLLEPLMARIAELGRLPWPEEFAESAEVTAVFGSLKRAFALIRQVTGGEAWDVLRQRRIDDLSVYLALGRFRRRPPIGALPPDLQHDIREFFGTYRQACQAADQLLFRAGDATAVDAACQRSPVGRLTSNALLVHRSALEALEPILRVYEGCGQAYLGQIDDANVVKLHRYSGKLSYLACPDFDRLAHPPLVRSVKLALRTLHLDCRDQTADEDPLLLDRKELLVQADYPGRSRFQRLSEQEQRYGLLGEALTDLAAQATWERKFNEAGVRLHGHRLLVQPGGRRVRSRPPSATQTAPRKERQSPKRTGAALHCCVQAGPPPADSDAAGVDPTAQQPMSTHAKRDRWASGAAPPLPTRSREFGVGKQVGSAVYVHRDFSARLGPVVTRARMLVPEDFVYDVVKYDRRTGVVSFVQCPDFDTQPEPRITAFLVVRPDGTVQRRTAPADPYIYHHKWLMVADDYGGFDVHQSQRRSASWLALADVDKSRIGRESYWNAHVVPRLEQHAAGDPAEDP